MKNLRKVAISFMLVGSLAAFLRLAALAQSEPSTEKGQTHQVYLPLINNMGDDSSTVQEEHQVVTDSTELPEGEPALPAIDDGSDETIEPLPAPEGMAVEAAAITNRTTGIWYSTWYAQNGNYIWAKGHGQGSTRQMLGDVNGDGKADAVVFFNRIGSESGVWYVALSTGSKFGAYSKWVAGHGFGSAMQFLADVDGNGKADAVVFFNQIGSESGVWYVALSDGSRFGKFTKWVTGHGAGSPKQLLADVSGDGRADAVVFFNQIGSESGVWYTATSTGSSFNKYTKWITGHGAGSNAQLLGDVSGDGKADAVVFFNQIGSEGGAWYVARSNGSRFDGYAKWTTGYGMGSTTQLLGDVNGDRKADVVVYFNEVDGNTGKWFVRHSTGAGFGPTNDWKVEHGNHYSDRSPSTWQTVAKVANDNRVMPVAFYDNGGIWKILPANYNKPNLLNTWEAWNINYQPQTLGKYQTYSSTNAAVIDEHLRLISDAQIDFLILDQTNVITTDGGYIMTGALTVCQRIQVWNAIPTNRKIRYAVAIGAIQFDADPRTPVHDTDPRRMEAEAKIVWEQFVQPCGPSNYFYFEGKPLLVSYLEYKYRYIWESWTGKNDANRFTIRWVQGQVPTNDNSTVPPSDYHLYFGWAYPEGALLNSNMMLVIPGWNNAKSKCISRTPSSGIEGDFYKLSGWQRVIAQKPQIVIINSFNEYAEQTAVAPTSTALLTPYVKDDCTRDEKWRSATFYWNMTKTYNQQYKSQ
jgi:phosphoribosyl-AMP cyclohydrolase